MLLKNDDTVIAEEDADADQGLQANSYILGNC